MKFSITSLLVAITLAAMLMLSVRNRVHVGSQRQQVAKLQRETDSRKQEHLISSAHVEICNQVVSRKFPSPMAQAEVNFQRLQQKRLYGEIKTRSETTVVSIPIISDSLQTHRRYRVFVPPNHQVDLMADALDGNGKPTKKGNVFLPSTFIHTLPAGESIVDIRVSRQAVPASGFTLLASVVKDIDVEVRRNEPIEVSRVGSLPTVFRWRSNYVPIDVLNEESSAFLQQTTPFQSVSKSILYSAKHQVDKNPSVRLEIFLKQSKQRGALPRRSPG